MISKRQPTNDSVDRGQIIPTNARRCNTLRCGYINSCSLISNDVRKDKARDAQIGKIRKESLF